MSERHYKFITPCSGDNCVTPTFKPIKYYQICGFANPRKLKYEVRVVYIDENNDIVNYKLLNLDKKIYNKLIHSLRDNEYRLFATYSLDHIELPSCADIAVARSDMICNDYEYSGFASVK